MASIGEVRRNARAMARARERVAEGLRELEGAERREALRIAQSEAGIRAAELARMIDVSPARMSKLLA
jgi:hypothetical protein